MVSSTLPSSVIDTILPTAVVDIILPSADSYCTVQDSIQQGWLILIVILSFPQLKLPQPSQPGTNACVTLTKLSVCSIYTVQYLYAFYHSSWHPTPSSPPTPTMKWFGLVWGRAAIPRPLLKTVAIAHKQYMQEYVYMYIIYICTPVHACNQNVSIQLLIIDTVFDRPIKLPLIWLSAQCTLTCILF